MIKSPVFLAVLLLLVTLVAVGYQALELNKVRLGSLVSVNEPQKIEQKKQNVAANNIPTFVQLGKMNLMGDPKKSLKKPSTENVVPITALKLTLMGTILKTDGGINSALIQGSNRETKRYYVGEMIEGGFILDSVTVDSAILTRNEQQETLKYPANVSTSVAIPPQPVPVAATQPVNRPQPQNSPAAGAGTGVEANKVKSLRERMRDAQARKNAQQNPAGQ